MRNQSSGARAGGALVLVLAQAIILTQSAQAQTFKVLYSFTDGTDGQDPRGTLLLYRGSLYSTTSAGGAFNCGAVFQLNIKTHEETTLYTFAGGPSDGCGPFAGLVRESSGNLYGTTVGGGAFGAPFGYGTVFQVNSAGVETLLHSFSGPDGDSPGYGNLVRDLAGNLYGATQAGGTPNSICSSGCGTVFKLDMAGELTTLYDFMGQPAGVGPNAGLLFEKNVLYGTTAAGGASNVGTVFEVNAKTGKMSVLYSFGGADGGSPVAGLIGDGAGNLYGTTRFGGLSDDGVVFMLTLATRQYTVLHSFSGLDGAQPFAALIRDSAGNLYGTTWEGGASPFPGGYGTVFKLDTSNNLTTLYSFTNEADGSYPSGGLAMDSMGRLYGSAGGGGSGGWGTIFEITP